MKGIDVAGLFILAFLILTFSYGLHSYDFISELGALCNDDVADKVKCLESVFYTQVIYVLLLVLMLVVMILVVLVQIYGHIQSKRKNIKEIVPE